MKVESIGRSIFEYTERPIDDSFRLVMSEIDPDLLADLLREAMREGKLPFLTVVSNSMSPLIRRGDQIQLAPATADQLQPGDIVVYTGPANLITHRYWGYMLDNGQTQLVTRGDRPQHFDKPFSPSNLVGQVIGRRRKRHFLDLAEGLGRWLNHHLTQLARLEIRIFATPPALSITTQQANLPQSGGWLSRSSHHFLIHLIRRFLYSWAIILSMIITTIVITFNKSSED